MTADVLGHEWQRDIATGETDCRLCKVELGDPASYRICPKAMNHKQPEDTGE